jgi:hypothetical protein
VTQIILVIVWIAFAVRFSRLLLGTIKQRPDHFQIVQQFTRSSGPEPFPRGSELPRGHHSPSYRRQQCLAVARGESAGHSSMGFIA